MKYPILLSCLLLLFSQCSKDSSGGKPDIRDKFMGDWDWLVTITYPSGTLTYNQNVKISNGTAADAVLIDFGNGLVVQSTLKDSLVTVPSQVVDGATLSGNIIYSKSNLIFTLSSKASTLSTKLNGSAKKGIPVADPRSIFLGPWTGSYQSVCSPSTGSTSGLARATIVEDLPGSVIVRSSPASDQSFNMKGTVSGSTITIPSQLNNIFTLQGRVTVTGSLITNSQSLQIIYSRASNSAGISSSCNITLTARRL
jgi:hypothetical protein